MALLTLTRALYPGIDPAEVGGVGREGYGTVEDVRIPAIEAGAASYLTATITATATSFDVKDASRFPAVPFMAQVGGELMTIGAKSGNTLSSITRGIGRIAAGPHGSGRTVYEVRTEYVYQVSPHPVRSIGAVYVDGIKQASGYAAYTGQSGSEHASYPGEAIVAFVVDPFVGQQRNMTGAAESFSYHLPTLSKDDGLGAQIKILTDYAAAKALDSSLTDEIAFTRVLNKGGDEFWFSWPTGTGTIYQSEATIYITNINESGDVPPVAIPSRIRISAVNTATGATIKTDVFYLEGNAVSLPHQMNTGTAWPVKITVTLLNGSVRIDSVSRIISGLPGADTEPEAEVFSTLILASDERLLRTVFTGTTASDGLPMGAGGRDSAWATFDATDRGAITRTLVSVLLNDADTDFKGWLLALDGTTLLSRHRLEVFAGEEQKIPVVSVPGASWTTHFAVIAESGDAGVSALFRDIYYIATNHAAGDSGATGARATIGERVTVDAEWHFSDDAAYGTVGALIERPDLAIKHFLVNYLGASLVNEIDGTSFNAAGVLYAAAITGGYKFGFILPQQSPQDTLATMGFCSRSTTRYLLGKYYHIYTPDTAPTAVRTLTRDDLAGEGSRYVFAKTSMRSVFNDLTVMFKPNYSGDSSREVSSGFLATAAATDAASVTKYGNYATTYAFPCVRSEVMAAHVLAHVLLEVATPLLGVEFTAFWEHSDLAVGQTIGITNPIYSGRSWWIERARRQSKYTASFVAREWWG